MLSDDRVLKASRIKAKEILSKFDFPDFSLTSQNCDERTSPNRID